MYFDLQDCVSNSCFLLSMFIHVLKLVSVSYKGVCLAMVSRVKKGWTRIW